MYVVSVSRRTDIPALFWKWFLNRLDAGYCHWVNPFNARQVFRVSLAPQDVAGFVFWTRNAGPMLPDLERLERDDYQFYVHYTINGYPPELERSGPNPQRAIAALRSLSEVVGPQRVIWRYDPIVFSSLTPDDYHVNQFARLADKVRGAVESAYISFCDPYGRTERRFKQLRREQGISIEYGDSHRHACLAQRLVEDAGQRGIRLFSCAEAALDVEGVEHGSCIDPQLLACMRPDLDFNLKAAPTREGCGCVQAVDIGSFDTCVFGCAYCYANQSESVPRRRLREHDSSDSILWRPPSLRGVNLDDPGVSKEQAPARIKPRRPSSDGQMSMSLGLENE